MVLVQGFDGYLYGTSCAAYFTRGGTVFKISLAGVVSTVYSFCSQPRCTDGSNPLAGLTLDANGNFYGATANYGAYAAGGTIFKLAPSGALTTLHRFCATSSACPDGAAPVAGLVLGNDGNLYGVTSAGGTNNAGTVFKITPAGKFTKIHDFCGMTNCADGANPQAALIQGADGYFYGTASVGGMTDGLKGYGTIFRVSSEGSFATLHSFDVTDGILPNGSMAQTPDGRLYGTTTSGGTYMGGTVFELDTSGTLTTLYSFCGACAIGDYPYSGLTLGTDGNLYGAASDNGAGGPDGGGLFSITPSGSLTELVSLGGANGFWPFGGLLQATNGDFYGTTWGSNGDEFPIAYQLSMGDAAFVKSVPVAGRVGTRVSVLGMALTGTTEVSFNGIPAIFTVVSPTQISTAVPLGASTGLLKVTTPAGVLFSNVKFSVRP